MRSQLSLCSLVQSDALAQSLRQHLRDKPYAWVECTSEPEFLDFVMKEKRQIDCLLLEYDADLVSLLKQLKQSAVFLPAAILDSGAPSAANPNSGAKAAARSESALTAATLYHGATLHLPAIQLGQIDRLIHKAIDDFLNLSPTDPAEAVDPLKALATHNSLMQQQRRLAEKLEERLGYLGVYYKRNPQNFFRHLTQSQKQELLRQLKADYRDIVLHYFSNDPKLNERIDNFVNMAFFADISVPQLVEIHMELIDEFAKQLKLEGRSDEVLLDYRLTLIDTIAHLCEMYRRSIPRET
ncbi:circadian clock protein KaiA [Oculatella sp. LEGE 06141]|uniref:circadian clock protein KaiA n=1 Tax=Oculatella sp. LEGE 06141 TaxID=1828648 RepID=UPI00187F80FB|nr:circadian clock protein KaiA [Oculatella sp. LEGE 06141]